MAITRGGDGAMWFTDFDGRVSRINAQGHVREYKVPDEAPTAITTGRDGAVWFTTAQTQFSSGLGRLSTSGHLRLYPGRHTCDTIPWGITAARDGTLWFSETHGPIGVARFDPAAAP